MAVTTPPADSTGMPSAGASGADPAASSDAGPGPDESQAVSSQESAAGEVEPDPKKNKKGFQLLPSLEGWRGLAHYRTESRRKVVKKKTEERTASDLYVLEESVKNVKLISDLPLAKRLEVCKYLGYEVWDENQHVYEQGASGSLFYIVFTGLVRASICEEGVQEPRTKVILPGDCFGELALLSDDLIMIDTAFTTERTELLTLSRDDYDKILKIEKTPEMKERVKFLKNIEAFTDVSKQSLQRLANVLSSRTYPKNKVITFQGDEAFEMFFIKSGECRIIMEINSVRKPVLRLPRVSTFVYMDNHTIHHKCKREVFLREKDYGRPSLISRPSQRGASTIKIPTGLPDVLLDSPDLIHELAQGHSRAQKADKVCNLANRVQSHLGSPNSKSKSIRPWSAPVSSRGKIGKDGPLRKDSLLILREQALLKAAKKVPQSPTLASTSPKVVAIIEEDRTLKKLTSPLKEEMEEKERQQSAALAKKRKSSYWIQPPKYTLDTFLSEVEAKDREVKDIDFSGKDHALWHMGMSQGAMKSGFTEDVKYYRNKFQKWARGVLDRERDLFGFNIFDDQQESPSFIKGAPKDHILRLEQGSGPASKNRKIRKDTMILDIGGLQAGDYFGERGLLKKSRRAVSIVTICPVEVLVLNMWDFHRHCDRDIIAALAENDYRKEEQIYKQYLKNCRWEQFKKKCLDDIVDNQNYKKVFALWTKRHALHPKRRYYKSIRSPFN
ncbi:unnamed protein product [Calypogeia fissa]